MRGMQKGRLPSTYKNMNSSLSLLFSWQKMTNAATSSSKISGVEEETNGLSGQLIQLRRLLHCIEKSNGNSETHTCFSPNRPKDLLHENCQAETNEEEIEDLHLAHND